LIQIITGTAQRAMMPVVQKQVKPGTGAMCRLYALRASEPTRVECSLVHAQNALMAQSRGDEEGLMHGHGWGVADYPDGVPMIERQTWAAFKGEHFAKKAARVYARTVVAHVRRATVGPPAMENTHPFVHVRWIFAHNGTVPNFPAVRDLMLEDINPANRADIHGTTDSEHVFHYLLSLWAANPQTDLIETLRIGLNQVVEWCRSVDPGAPIGLNVILTDGEKVVGSRLGRSLWFLERDGVFTCDICGKSHTHHDPKAAYRSAEVASERITPEPGWKGVPEASVFSIDRDYRFRFLPLEAEMARRDNAVQTARSAIE
jgi:glutamine amidotransferase